MRVRRCSSWSCRTRAAVGLARPGQTCRPSLPTSPQSSKGRRPGLQPGRMSARCLAVGRTLLPTLFICWTHPLTLLGVAAGPGRMCQQLTTVVHPCLLQVGYTSSRPTTTATPLSPTMHSHPPPLARHGPAHLRHCKLDPAALRLDHRLTG